MAAERSGLNRRTDCIRSRKDRAHGGKTVQHYLNHKGYTDRSFEILKKRVGGFEEDELRKILVRAGAVRYIRDDGSEWWRLLSRNPEAGEMAKSKEIDVGSGNEDL